MRKQGQGWIGRGRETLSQHARGGVEAVRELRAHLLCRGLAQLLGRPGAARPAGRARMGVSCCNWAGGGASHAHAEFGLARDAETNLGRSGHFAFPRAAVFSQGRGRPSIDVE